jgi:hypothetical protein
MNKFLLLISLILISVLFFSCKEKVTDVPVGNKPPETFLFLYPDSSLSQQSSRLSVHWWGDDPDGLVIGYIFRWEGLDSVWHFTSSNDSTFNLPIGTVDTSFIFKIAAVDDDGNGIYDKDIIWNGIHLGPEPFIDADKNGIYTPGEKFYDFGNIDPTPSELKFPIKNSAPQIKWNELSSLPETSFPVITIAWDISDLDGDQTVTKIYLALNDTINYVTLEGNTRIVTLRARDFSADNPPMEILINGSESKIFSEKLNGLKLNNNNVIYIQAEDIAGAKSDFIRLPDTSSTWYVKKPTGKLLLVDDFAISDSAADKKVNDFYINAFNTINSGSLIGKYDLLDLYNTNLPYQNITFNETLKLFKYVFWFSGSRPTLDLASSVTNSFLSSGGKIFFSLTFEDPTDAFTFSLSDLQAFLPVDSLGEKKSLSFLFPGAVVQPCIGQDYPILTTASTIGSARTFYPNTVASDSIYNISSSQLKGKIAFMNKEKTLFFIGLPLHQCNGGSANVNTLLDKIFFEDFGLTP